MPIPEQTPDQIAIRNDAILKSLEDAGVSFQGVGKEVRNTIVQNPDGKYLVYGDFPKPHTWTTDLAQATRLGAQHANDCCTHPSKQIPAGCKTVVVESVVESVTTGDVADRVGSFALQAENPGLMPSLKSHKKSKRSKVEYSPFTNDKDASKVYIKGQMDNNGSAGSKSKTNKKTKIHEMIDNRMDYMVLESVTTPHEIFDGVVIAFGNFMTEGKHTSTALFDHLGFIFEEKVTDPIIELFVKKVYNLFAEDMNSTNLTYLLEYATKRSSIKDDEIVIVPKIVVNGRII